MNSLPILNVIDQFTGLACKAVMVPVHKLLKGKNRFIAGIFCAAIPTVAWAYREEVLLFPVGQLAAVIVVGIIAWHFSSRSIIIRSIVIICAAGAALTLWFTPVALITGSRPNETEYFLMGLVPPTAVAIVVALILSLFRKRS